MSLDDQRDLRVRSDSVTEKIMDRFKQLLLEGTFAPGDKLPTESELASLFGVGRSSIREALRVFTYLGIFETRVPKGTFVKAGTEIYQDAISWSFLLQPKEISHTMEYREAIEAQSIRTLAERHREDPELVEKTLSALEALCRDMTRNTHEFDYEQLNRADYEFHLQVVRGGGNPYFVTIFDLLSSFLATTTREITKRRVLNDDIVDVGADHRHYLPAIRSGNPAEAEEAVHSHMRLVYRWLSETEST